MCSHLRRTCNLRRSCTCCSRLRTALPRKPAQSWLCHLHTTKMQNAIEPAWSSPSNQSIPKISALSHSIFAWNLGLRSWLRWGHPVRRKPNRHRLLLEVDWITSDCLLDFLDWNDLSVIGSMLPSDTFKRIRNRCEPLRPTAESKCIYLVLARGAEDGRHQQTLRAGQECSQNFGS